MILELIQQSDYISTVRDSLNSIGDAQALTNMTFDLSNIGSEALILSVLGYTIVFVSLLTLFLILVNLAKILQLNLKKKLRAMGLADVDKEELTISGEINAAIATALSLHFAEVHDFENTVITIKKIQRPYSPWSSKIYGLRHYPKT